MKETPIFRRFLRLGVRVVNPMASPTWCGRRFFRHGGKNARGGLGETESRDRGGGGWSGRGGLPVCGVCVIGARVRRIGGRAGWREGEVVCLVPPMVNPEKVWRRWYGVGGAGLWRGSGRGLVVRDDWSCVVLSGGKYYWPRVAMLEVLESSRDGGIGMPKRQRYDDRSECCIGGPA